ncbi:MAG: S8 family peptidase [Bacteroidota bacterium]
MFKNKNGTPYTIANANDFLSVKSINRRIMYNTPVDQTDLPVTPAYISQVDNVNGVKVLYASKWLNGVVVSVPNADLNVALNTINNFPFVMTLAPVNRYAVNYPKTSPDVGQAAGQQSLKTTNTASFNMGGSYWQNKQMNLDCLHDAGYRGKGITIAVLDAGFSNVNNSPMYDSLRARGGIIGTRDFVAGGNSVYEDGDHGAAVLSCMAAIKPGVIMGSAPAADYWLLRTEEGAAETLTEEYNWIRGAEFADSVGVDILTTSLGYTTFDNSAQNHNYNTLNGRTAPMSIAATMAARKGMFVLNAAGNEGASGWQYICVPADADSICTVGAIDTLSNYASFSSVGPTADGRIKPDLVARGLGAWIASSDGSVCFPGNGTSFATPVLAGAVACYWQAHRGLNNIQLLKTLKNSASNKNSPNNFIGWGKPDMCSFVVGMSEVNAAKSDAGLNVSPNPFNAFVNISLENAGDILSIEITDVLGKVIKTVNINTSTYVLNTSELKEGVYFVKVDTGSGILTKKIIRQ